MLNEFTRPSLREPSKKEVRRENKAARQIQRAAAKYPELRTADTVLTQVSVRTPQIARTIVQPFLVPGPKEFVQLPGDPVFIGSGCTPFHVDFDDELLSARFSRTSHGDALDYTLKERDVKAEIAVPCPPRVQATRTRYVPRELAWWQKVLMAGGILFLIERAYRIALKQFTPRP